MSGEIPSAALADIYAHAREGYPEEVCGFVLAGGEVHRCENQQNKMHTLDPETYPRTAREAYTLGFKDLRFMETSLQSERPVRMIYHSHVEVGAYFSAEDVRAAAPEGELIYPVDYLVVDVKSDGVHGAKLFRFEGGRFLEVGHYGP
jgi:[CysO sulfur-carrier protein]-S-L-cysteine hydrolase